MPAVRVEPSRRRGGPPSWQPLDLESIPLSGFATSRTRAAFGSGSFDSEIVRFPGVSIPSTFGPESQSGRAPAWLPYAGAVRPDWYQTLMSITGGGEGVGANAVRTEFMKVHTIAEWLAEPEDRRLELLDGELVEKAAPDITHGLSQARLITAVSGPFNRPPGHGGLPGGWWIGSEVDVRLGKDGFRPDVCGWRRDRVASIPRTRPVEVVPDWICEVLSESDRANDTVRKLRRYHQAGVGHYWLLDPTSGLLSVFRHQAEGYLNVLAAERHQVVLATPFDAVELRVAELLGDDPPEALPR